MRPILRLMLGIKYDPVLFSALWTRIRPEGPSFIRRKVRPGDDALIEGYPRSANTFASYAFDEAHGGHVRFGNHYHSPAQFFLAHRYGVPSMLLLRNPIDAALSSMLYKPRMDAHEALVRYIAFHRPLLAIASSFVVAPFEEVTTDFGRSIERLNRRLGTAFVRFPHDKVTEKRVFDRIQTDLVQNAKKHRGDGLNPLKAYNPNEEKRERGNALRRLFDAPPLDPLKREAHELHAALLSRA